MNKLIWLKKAAEIVLSEIKKQLDDKSIAHFNGLRKMWREASEKNNFPHQDIFSLDEKQKIAKIEIPDKLKELKIYSEGDEYHQYREFIKSADQTLEIYLGKLEKYSETLHHNVPANVFAIKVVGYFY